MNREILHILLRPLASFCVKRSIKLQSFIDVFKELLVAAAKEELSRTKEKLTSSRLSVMTGVHRKDVKKILEDPIEEDSGKNLIARVIGQWQQAEEFTTQAGRPRILSITGVNSEFNELVRSVSVDLNPQTVLFELERIAAVERSKRGLRLLADFYLPSGDFKDGYSLLASDLDYLLNAVSQNIHRETPDPHLHLKTEYDRIPVKYLSKVKNWLLKEGSAFHKRARSFIAQYDADVNQAHKGSDSYARIAVVSFSFSDQVPKENEDND